MNTNDLNTALYEKMAAEQDKFRDWLKSQPPEEILHHTYEYTVREDIVMAMEELELTDLIRLESDLKKHHRAYLHVREDIDEKVKEARQIMTKVSVDMIGFYFKVDVPKCSNSDENTPFADAADDETVSIPKDEYELMIDDLLTMSEIIQCVADMRTQDVKAIREFGKFVPAFAAFEKNRLSLYREAAKEAEEIFDRWADEIDDLDEDFMEDEDYEPDEYYSD